jgi:hypothetical protein
VEGVTVEAQYKVDEYEIVILSAKRQLAEQWLTTSSHRIPEGATKVLRSYIKQKVYFFVAKVDVTEQERLDSITPDPGRVRIAPLVLLPSEWRTRPVPRTCSSSP